MTTLSPPPVGENILHFAEPQPEPPSRWRRFLPRSRRAKALAAGGMTVLLVAGFLGATYESSPGGTLWGVQKTIFAGHSHDVALAAVVSDLKQAQEILDSGAQPSPDQLTAARSSLNHAKQNLDYLPDSPQRTSLQNLYLQLTQQLLQYTPDSAQQLPPLPAPPPTDDPGPVPDAALASAAAPSWGYPITDQSGTLAPPPGVPDAPLADWPAPYAPPLTPNLGDLGYYDPSWGQLYGYNAGDWYNYDLSGYNRYGYDFLGFDRWGYDRWGYDRWGYDHWGYNWAGYNWAGYDRHGWDRDGRNDWGQRRGHPADPRNHDWYNRHHPYVLYYQWRFQINDPVFHRTLWNRAHGFDPNRYRDWNANRDWRNPRNRDWAPVAATSVAHLDVHASLPVVNLNASLTQFVSVNKATSRPLMKDLADKSARDFTNELKPRITIPIGAQPLPTTLGKLAAVSNQEQQKSLAPPALTATAPALAPSKVSPGFTAPKVSPVPAFSPPKADPPRGRPDSAPANQAPRPGRSPAVALPDEVRPAAPPPRAAEPAPEATAPRPAAPREQLPRQSQEAPAPRAEAPAPRAEEPARQAPVHQAPAPRAQQQAPQQPARQAPQEHQASPAAPRQAPAQHGGGKCSMPTMC